MGKDLQNRAEVPNTYEMRTSALGAEKGWRVGSLDVKTAFLDAELNEEEDGIVAVQPPPHIGEDGAGGTWMHVETQEGALRAQMCTQEMEPGA